MLSGTSSVLGVAYGATAILPKVKIASGRTQRFNDLPATVKATAVVGWA